MSTDHQQVRGGNPGAIEAAAIHNMPFSHPVLGPPPSVNPINSPQPHSSSHTSITNTSNLSSSSTHCDPRQVKLALSVENSQTRKHVLGDAVFPDWRDDATSADLSHPEEMQKRDPLGTQIWRLYSRTKSQLPNQERMENLTWRMMAMNLKRKEQERARFVALRFAFVHHHYIPSLLTSRRNRISQQNSSAPSGIAQLRQSQDLTKSPDSDPMNLDDFIVSSSVASPTNITTPSPPVDHAPAPSNAVAAAIPINKSRKESDQIPHPNFVPSAPSHDRSRAREFEYVKRRVRKTSIDETKVGLRVPVATACEKLTRVLTSLENAPPSFLLRLLLQTGLQCLTKMSIKVCATIV